MAYELIETVTLTSATSSIQFNSIPQDGVDLLCVVSSRNTDANTSIGFSFNSSSSSFSTRHLYNTGSSVITFSSTSLMAYTNPSSATANSYANTSIYIASYTGSSNKTFSIDSVRSSNAFGVPSGIIGGQWASSPITSFRLNATSSNHETGTTASLYKIS